ncbi:uncharacterized protein KIAA0513-like [Xenia sp. Carnegie-2017]|uniref:uncharacterized protein KIAA0513-like n=1 Tax=Xenia sp. Carnegie-2017 TaxID=2897299 RepID=UPI001F03F7D0|nr:uncharacterized protein KIAA0513-like [Xenia sp. Carnegie-2017]XP_046842262.1 uncharacterized protein KIAA0513-like [Xenia sp. Carnegie-2017]XP_046842263.1 uncharacterized protein KIAA0513-like [Xenia sp. Carnegie-2017]XP_046842264.1 uncharacterized protein KIAA0513-like [Xenia sp. Carnegie-2017]
MAMATTMRRDVFEDSLSEDNGYQIDYDAETSVFTNECKEFMNMFVSKIFSKGDMSQEEKAQFGVICQHAAARRWFARYINMQRENMCVDETIFFRLVQYFATVLFECHQADDFSPAKTLMNMCFTFYQVFYSGKNTEKKEFLHTYLRDQPIWRTLRFWNAAFLDSVHSEQDQPTLPQSDWDTLSDKEKNAQRDLHKNRMFGQLGSFASNMKAFGLPKATCEDFIQKMSTIGDLDEEQILLLQKNFEKN